MTTNPSSPPASQMLRPTVRVGLIAGLTLALAAAAQQLPSAPEMRLLGLFIVMAGFGFTGYFAARDSGAAQRNAGYGVGALSGLIAGLFVSGAFIAVSVALSFDPQNVARLQAEVERQLGPAQRDQIRAADLSLETLTQFSLGLSIALCGLGFPVAGLLLGALGGASGAARNQQAKHSTSGRR
jgi:hypothetical protein